MMINQDNKSDGKYVWNMPTIRRVKIIGARDKDKWQPEYLTEMAVFYEGDIVTTYEKRGNEGSQIPENELYRVLYVEYPGMIRVDRVIPDALNKRLWRVCSTKTE